MTSNQIRKALLDGGVDMTGIARILKDEIHIVVADPMTMQADARKTARIQRQVAKIFKWRGFTTNSGMVVLKAYFDADSAAQRNVD